MVSRQSINYQAAEFMTSASKLSQCPDDENGLEVAFAGRSNAGKSSAINALTRNKKLSRTSKTPGRTRLINFFKVADSRYLVDLPGYGYAKVSEKVKLEWQYHLSHYLNERKTLCGIVLLMDIRHPLKEFDQMMLKWARDISLPIHILLTKSDKLSKNASKATFKQVSECLADMKDLVSIQLFSSTKNLGVDILIEKLDSWLLK